MFATRYIKVLNGCARELVCQRELRTTYQTNRNIKAWAIYFLLKSETTSGHIQHWYKQRAALLNLCGCSINVFRKNLDVLQTIGLISHNTTTKLITLCSYERAAEILGIEYQGTTLIEYKLNNNAKQFFQYQLIAEDIRINQDTQATAMMKALNNNPNLKTIIDEALKQSGADERQLNKPRYYAGRLLQLQINTFTQGSEIYNFIHQVRADLNRSVKTMAGAYMAKSPSTISDIKKRLAQLAVITVTKVIVESDVRSRKYLPDGKDAYKWIDAKKITAWRLCDQITVTYRSQPDLKAREGKKEYKNAA